MAYMDQDKKRGIAEALKEAVPAGWKYTLAVRHHSGIVMTIREAPLDLLEVFRRRAPGIQCESINPYYFERQFEGQALEAMRKVMAALNKGNHRHSDLQTDYLDVGHYVDVRIGESSDKPFVCTAPQIRAQRAAGADTPADESDEPPRADRMRG